ncbi:hypothetical protein QFZ66_000326 [Streptomyces sp. B4I13]|nr:hypothetical protein [Streptomyces sp. B4I13]
MARSAMGPVWVWRCMRAMLPNRFWIKQRRYPRQVGTTSGSD